MTSLRSTSHLTLNKHVLSSLWYYTGGFTTTIYANFMHTYMHALKDDQDLEMYLSPLTAAHSVAISGDCSQAPSPGGREQPEAAYFNAIEIYYTHTHTQKMRWSAGCHGNWEADEMDTVHPVKLLYCALIVPPHILIMFGLWPSIIAE